MTARLHRLDECEKFRKYKRGSMLGPDAPSFDPKRPKMMISKAIELEHAEMAREKAIQSGIVDLSEYETEIQKFRQDLDAMFRGEESSKSIQGCGSCSCTTELWAEGTHKRLEDKGQRFG